MYELFFTWAALALPFALAAQLGALWARASHLGPIVASALALQTLLAMAMHNPLHRVLSAFFATIAWTLTVRFALFGEPGFRPGQHEVSASFAESLAGWLVAWLPIVAGVVLAIRHEPGWTARGWQPVARPVLAGLVVGIAFATVASQPFESFRWFGDGPSRPNWLALWPMLSVLAALGGIAAAFALRSRALIGACMFAALLHLSHFYYVLGASLTPYSARGVSSATARSSSCRLRQSTRAR